MADGLPIFFGDAEEALFNALGRELTETLVNQHFDLFRVDIVSTDSNFYGESKNKIYKPVTEVKARIQIVDADVVSEGGIRRLSKGDMNAWVYLEHITELDIEINVGDFIGFQGKFYEIFDPGYNKDSMDKKFAADRDFMREIFAKVVHEDVFKSIEGNS
jgi:hypothetical protein